MNARENSLHDGEKREEEEEEEDESMFEMSPVSERDMDMSTVTLSGVDEPVEELEISTVPLEVNWPIHRRSQAPPAAKEEHYVTREQDKTKEHDKTEDWSVTNEHDKTKEQNISREPHSVTERKNPETTSRMLKETGRDRGQYGLSNEYYSSNNNTSMDNQDVEIFL